MSAPPFLAAHSHHTSHHDSILIWQLQLQRVFANNCNPITSQHARKEREPTINNDNPQFTAYCYFYACLLNNRNIIGFNLAWFCTFPPLSWLSDKYMYKCAHIQSQEGLASNTNNSEMKNNILTQVCDYSF